MPRALFPALPLLSALLLTACGASAPPPPPEPPPPPPPVASAAPPPAPETAAAGPSRRAPADTLLRYWPFDAHPRLALYGDGGGLLRTELGSAIVPAALAMARGTITEAQALCLRGAADSVKDLLVGADDDGVVFIARFDDSAFDPTPCLTAAGAAPARIEGASRAVELHGAAVVHEPGILIVGPDRQVVTAMQPRTSASSFPRGLTLGPDEYAAWAARIDENVRGQGTLLASSERFRLTVEADVPMFIAQQAEGLLRGLRGQPSVPGLDGEAGAMAAKLLQSVDVKREGSHLKASFDLHEPVADQARDLGMAAAIAISGFRQYLGEAKSAEARHNVGQIARDYAAWWAREDGKPRGSRKLLSFPAVPGTVPRGTKYQSTPADWQPWAPLRFQLDDPQYYQYEVRASRDGSGADVIARGDLDGDGQTSEFRLHIAVDRAHGNTLTVGTHVDERDPEE